MSYTGYLICIALTIPGFALGNHNDTGRALWNNVYQDYVCNTADGYLWLADACSFPLRRAIDYFINYGDDTNTLYDDSDQTFNDVTLEPHIDGSNDTLDTYLYDYAEVFPYAENKICTDYMDLARTCMQHYFSNCSSDYNSDVETYVNSYKTQFCDGDVLHEYIQSQRGVFSAFIAGNTRRAECTGLEDLYDDFKNGVVCTEDVILESPYAPNTDNITAYTDTSPDSFDDFRSEYATTLRSAMRCMEVELRGLGCPTSQAQSLVIFMYNHIVPIGIDVDLESMANVFSRPGEANSLTTGNEADRDRSTCGIFGQSHIMQFGRTSDSDQSTCYMRRRWTTLATNKFVEVNVLPALEMGSTDYDSTYLSAVEITMLDGSGTTLASFSAADGDLDVNDYTIIDSKTEIVSSDSDEFLSLQQLDDGSIAFTNPLGDVAVMINRYGLLYGLWIRMYDDDFERSYGTLIDGCEKEADLNAVFGSSSRKRRKRDVSEACQSGCQTIGTDIFEESCEYDCTVNGGDLDTAMGTSNVAGSSYSETTETDSAMVQEYKASATKNNFSNITAIFLIFLSLLLSSK